LGNRKHPSRQLSLELVSPFSLKSQTIIEIEKCVRASRLFKDRAAAQQGWTETRYRLR
jgi:hypothetical protein